MLRGINIVQFYESANDRRWAKANVKEFCVVFDRGCLPNFSLFVSGAPDLTTLTDLRRVDNNLSCLLIQTPGVDVGGGYSRYDVMNNNLNGHPDQFRQDGYYEYRITINGKTYYSEVFGIKQDCSKLFKIKVTSANLTLSNSFLIPMQSYNTWYFHLFYNGISTDSEITEDGVEKPYGNMAVFNTLNIKKTVEINGTVDILKFLYLLRLIETNGTVTIKYNNIEYGVFNVETNVVDDGNFSETIIIGLKFREQDFISVRNDI